MNFTIEITASQALLEAIKVLASALTGQLVNSVAPAKESAKKAKAIAASSTTVEETASVTDAASPAETATATAPTFTLEQVRAAAQAKSQSGKREEVRALVTEFGASNLPSLDPSKFSDFMSKLEAL